MQPASAFVIRLVSNQTNLLEKIIDLQVHLQDGLVTTLVMKGDDERARRRRRDIEVDVRTPAECFQHKLY